MDSEDKFRGVEKGEGRRRSTSTAKELPGGPLSLDDQGRKQPTAEEWLDSLRSRDEKLPSVPLVNQQTDRLVSQDPLSRFAQERDEIHASIEKRQRQELDRADLRSEPSKFSEVCLFQEPEARKRKNNRPEICVVSSAVEDIPDEIFKSTSASRRRIFKVIIVGDTNVGKTCLALRFCQGRFPEKSEATIGVDFREKSIQVGEETIKLQLWDTGGQERFRKSMVPHYYRNANAIVFVYDVTKLASFESLPGWIAECNDYNDDKDIPRILIGNKCDLHDQVAISTNRAQQFADLHQMPLFETSAKTGGKCDNVESIFLTLAYKLKCCRPWMQVPRGGGGGGTISIPVLLTAGTSKQQRRGDGFCACF